MAPTRDLVQGVHRLGTWTVNWYLVEDGGRFTAVDAGLPGFRGTLEADLVDLGAGLADVEAVVLTHSDGDHIGLASALKESGARVLIHTSDAETLRKPGPKGGDAKPINTLPQLWRPSFWRFMVSIIRSGGGRIRGVEGAETFADGDLLDVPGRPRVIPTPGHTNGHCAFQFEQHRALFVGDATCSYNPITARRGPQLMPRSFNESNADARRSLDALEPIEADVMLFGHGEPWRGGVGEAVRQARAAAS